MRLAISAAIIQHNHLLLVRKKDTWILPGGKPENNEADISCLCREIDEELLGTQITNISYYNQFEGITPHKQDILRAKVYFADITGRLYGVRAEDSISEVQWVNDFSTYHLSDITTQIVSSLKQDNYLR